jgi:hypothetical protein
MAFLAAQTDGARYSISREANLPIRRMEGNGVAVLQHAAAEQQNLFYRSLETPDRAGSLWLTMS